MKTGIYLMVGMLFATVLASCARGAQVSDNAMLKPGDKIGDMTVTEHPNIKKYPDIFTFCIHPPEETEPGSWTMDCDMPFNPTVQFSVGWGAKDLATTDANWNAMAWELYIDGYQIDLEAFGKRNDRYRQGADNIYFRSWVIDLNNITPGSHTVRYLWKSEIPIDDGWNVYAPGTYEFIANFAVKDK